MRKLPDVELLARDKMGESELNLRQLIRYITSIIEEHISEIEIPKPLLESQINKYSREEVDSKLASKVDRVDLVALNEFVKLEIFESVANSLTVRVNGLDSRLGDLARKYNFLEDTPEKIEKIKSLIPSVSGLANKSEVDTKILKIKQQILDEVEKKLKNISSGGVGGGSIGIQKSNKLSLLKDVDVTGILDNQAIAWNESTGKFEPAQDITAFAGTNKAFQVGDELLKNISAGMYKWSSPGLAIASATSVTVSAGDGHIVNWHDDPDNPTYTSVDWVEQTIIIANANDVTYIYIDSSGVAQSTTTELTAEQRRENIFLGRAIDVGGTIVQVQITPDFILNPMNQVHELFDGIGLVNEGIGVSNAGSNLELQTASGRLLTRGANFINNRAQPNLVDITGANPQTFAYVTQLAGSTGANTTDIVPGSYDVAGTITAIPGSNNRATNQRIYLFPSGNWRVQYGQNFYNSLAEAIQNASTESFTVNPNIPSNGILIAALSITKGCTDLSDTSTARFLPGGRFGEIAVGGSGQSVTTLQQAYNNSSDGTIITSSASKPIVFQGGSGTDTDTTHKFNNNAGTSVLTITGAGVMTRLLTSASQTAFAVNNSLSNEIVFIGSGSANSGQIILKSSAGTNQFNLGGLNNQLQTPNGNALLPSHSFINDADSGMYLVGTNNIGFGVGGVLGFQESTTGSTIRYNFNNIIGGYTGNGIYGHTINGLLTPHYQVVTADITDSNITTAKIADNAITNAKMADDSVDTAEIVDDAVTTAKILDENVTYEKLEDGLVSHPAYASGRYYRPYNAGEVAGSTVALINTAVIYVLHHVPRPITLDKISIQVTTAATGSTNLARLGLYDESNGYPNTRLVDAGTVDISTTGVKEITGLAQALDPGWYFLAVLPSDTVSVRGYGTTTVGGDNYHVIGTSAFNALSPVIFQIQLYASGLPATAGASELTGSIMPDVSFRL